MKHVMKHTIPATTCGALFMGFLVLLIFCVPASSLFWLLSLVDAPGYVRFPASLAFGVWSFLRMVSFK
jgi:hypothetical protein